MTKPLTPAQLAAAARRAIDRIAAHPDANAAARALEDVGGHMADAMEETYDRARLDAAMKEALLT